MPTILRAGFENIWVWEPQLSRDWCSVEGQRRAHMWGRLPGQHLPRNATSLSSQESLGATTCFHWAPRQEARLVVTVNGGEDGNSTSHIKRCLCFFSPSSLPYTQRSSHWEEGGGKEPELVLPTSLSLPTCWTPESSLSWTESLSNFGPWDK